MDLLLSVKRKIKQTQKHKSYNTSSSQTAPRQEGKNTNRTLWRQYSSDNKTKYGYSKKGDQLTKVLDEYRWKHSVKHKLIH